MSNPEDIAAFKDFTDTDAGAAPPPKPKAKASTPPPAPAPAKSPPPPSSAPAASARQSVPVSGGEGRVFASPFARSLAAQRGIDLTVRTDNVLFK